MLWGVWTHLTLAAIFCPLLWVLWTHSTLVVIFSPLLWVLWTYLTLAVVFCPIQALVVQLSPKEAVVLAGETTPDSAKVKEVLGRSGLLITERKRGIVVCLISSSSPFGQLVNT